MAQRNRRSNAGNRMLKLLKTKEKDDCDKFSQGKETDVVDSAFDNENGDSGTDQEIDDKPQRNNSSKAGKNLIMKNKIVAEKLKKTIGKKRIQVKAERRDTINADTFCSADTLIASLKTELLGDISQTNTTVDTTFIDTNEEFYVEDVADNLQTTSSACQFTKKRIADKEQEMKRPGEFYRVPLPEAPPHKRPKRQPSPDREPCVFVSTQAASSCPPSPQPSTSSEDVKFTVTAPEYYDPFTGSEVEVPASTSTSEQLQSIIDTEDVETDFEVTVRTLARDSESDTDDDITNEEHCPFLIPRQADITNDEDLTAYQERILEAEDCANDEALSVLLSEDCFTFNWTNDKKIFTSKRETFTGTPGPTFEVTDATTPTDVFSKMFDVDFIDRLCVETNRYARQKIDSTKDTMPPCSRLHHWKPTDREEIICFMALMILQGLYPLVNEESYFKFNGFGTLQYFPKIMTYNRYLFLKSLLHFVDNKKLTDLTTTSILYKIQPVIDYFNKQFSSLYYPQQEIAIDESLLKWCGRLSFTQKINNKAAQVGITTYELCESATGYLWRFSVYSGKPKTNGPINNEVIDDDHNDNAGTDNTGAGTEQTSTDFRPDNATAKIVFNLVEPLLHKGHTLIMDNFYNSPLLARCLKLRQTDCYGTQRLNREFVPMSIMTLTDTDLRQGELVASYCRDLSIMVWRNAKLVSLISTYHTLQIGIQEKNNKLTFKPRIVFDYNKHMGGVDRKDQYLSAHPIERIESRVWYKKLFRHLFNTAVFNCWEIHHTKHSKMTHRQFRTVLAEDLLKTYRNIDLKNETRLISRPNCRKQMTMTQRNALNGESIIITYNDGQLTTRTQRNSKLSPGNRPYVEGDHFPIPTTDTKRNRCWMCSRNPTRNERRTTWKCMECGIHLCIVGCFRDFHKP